MVTNTCFDFTNKDYVIGDDSALLAQEKALGKKGKTQITIQRLLQLKKTDEVKNLEKLYELTQFIKSLSKHVATSIHKRCRFSWLRVPICSFYGPLNDLSCLEQYFNSKFAEQKKSLTETIATHIKTSQADVPHLLHSLFTIDPSAKTGVAKVDALYKLIQKDGLFAPQESIQLAWYLANNPSIGAHVKKNALLGLPRSLFSDSKGRVFICQKGNKTKRIVATEVKSISKALMLQNLAETTVVAQATTLDILSSETRGSVCREYHIAQELQEHPGIWPVHHGDKYIKEKNDKKISKFTYFSDYAVTAFSAPAKAKTLSVEALIKVTKTLLSALTYIHNKGYLHVDIKGDNILMKDSLDDAGIIDFGLSGKIDDVRIVEFFKDGRYGTRKYSAPELFGVRGFCGDYQKTDVWGLGLTLLRARLAGDPTWFQFIPPKNAPVTYQNKRDYKDAIVQQIDLPLKALLEKKNLTKEEQLDLVIYQMVQSDPDNRPTAATALTLANKL